MRELYEEFHDKGWQRFNSDKRCAVAYARIQSRRSLIAHFQNSSLMHEDKRCRPVLINLEGSQPEAEPFPPPRRSGGAPAVMGATNRRLSGRGTPSTPGGSVGRPSRDSTESPRGLALPARLSPAASPRSAATSAAS